MRLLATRVPISQALKGETYTPAPSSRAAEMAARLAAEMGASATSQSAAQVSSKTGRIILLKHNKPVAAIVPINDSDGEPFELWGALKGTMTLLPDVDLTEPTGEIWDAEQ